MTLAIIVSERATEPLGHTDFHTGLRLLNSFFAWLFSNSLCFRLHYLLKIDVSLIYFTMHQNHNINFKKLNKLLQSVFCMVQKTFEN